MTKEEIIQKAQASVHAMRQLRYTPQESMAVSLTAISYLITIVEEAKRIEMLEWSIAMLLQHDAYKEMEIETRIERVVRQMERMQEAKSR